ncbi:MAG: DUF444 family protein, partial [Lentisphaerae bacterium]
GSGDGQEGDVTGKEPVHAPDGTGQGGAGSGEGAEHDVSSDAYELGRILTEKFQLPNLQDKGKKRSLTRYNYDLTNRNRGEGQVIDKKDTLKQIIKTNIGLGIIDGPEGLDPSRFIVAKRDLVYRVLAQEQDYESQAMVFFLRDYSGSMYGPPTEAIVSQHILIYTWLMYQYQKQVETRFIVHDTEAKEVPDFYTYAQASVAGGTQVCAALELVHKIVTEENLAQDYNLYIFYGGDGDDWDSDGKKSLQYLQEILTYANRVAFVIARPNRTLSNLERYLKNSELLEKHPKLLRMDTVQAPAEEEELIESLKRIIS